MGAELICRVRHRDQASQGLALLETGELLFRGDFRFRIPFREIESIECKGPELHVAYGDEIAVFELGKAAEAWAAKIRNPRGRLEKLGVKPGQRLSVLGLQDADFVVELRALSTNVSIGSIAPGSDLVFYAATEVDDLAHLPELRESLAQKGAIWVVSAKGKAATVRDTDVIAAARAAGLVDTKVVAFSETRTALKLVIPVAQRVRA